MFTFLLGDELANIKVCKNKQANHILASLDKTPCPNNHFITGVMKIKQVISHRSFWPLYPARRPNL